MLKLRKIELDLKKRAEERRQEEAQFESQRTMFVLEKENFDSKMRQRDSRLKAEQKEKQMLQQKIRELVHEKANLESK